MASLFDLLIQDGFISTEQLEDAKTLHIEDKIPIQKALIDLKIVFEGTLAKAASHASNLPISSIATEEKTADIVDLIPVDILKKYGIFPVRQEDDTLILAMSNPQDIIAIDDISALLNLRVRPILCQTSQIYQFIEESHQSSKEITDMMEGVVSEHKTAKENVTQKSPEDANKSIHVEFSGGQRLDIENIEDGSPTVKLINLIMIDAIKVRASDIHLEPREDCLEVRYRIDGDLKNIMRVPRNVHPKMVARIKILAKLDITQDIKPQDGRLHLMVNERKVDFRISTIPTYYGEKVVARILDAKEAKTELDLIGLEDDEKKLFEDAIKRPQGMVLVTGPTGSGKTSTLYAGLNYVKGESTNIVTIEDPIEFINEGINQIQVNPGRGVTFASGLRSILRQDPNVILIGEIRDHETAEIAMKASLTGHLVLSTLHTNSALATITRLIDIGLDHYLVASGVILIASQRLVKKICSECKIEYTPEDAFLKEFEAVIKENNITKFYKGAGCPKCSFSGYSGRIAVFEVLRITQKMQDLIGNQATESELRIQARADGCRLLAESGILKVKQGVTTLEEAKKVLGKLLRDQVKDEPKKTTAPQKPLGPAIIKDIMEESLPEDTKKDALPEKKEPPAQKTTKKKSPKVKETPVIPPQAPIEKDPEISVSSPEPEQLPEEIIPQEPPVPIESVVEKVPEPPAAVAPPPAVQPTQEISAPEIKEVPVQADPISTPSEEKSDKKEETSEKNKYTILVAEDEIDLQKILNKVLGMAGYNVIIVSNGQEAVVQTFKNKPDLLIMDVMMPEMNGFEATEILRSRLETAVVPIIMLTAHTDKESRARGMKIGVDAYMEKPFNRAILMSKIEELLSKGDLKDGLFQE